MQTGLKPTSAIINKLLNISITDKDLENLLKKPKHVFQDLTNRKKVFNKLSNLGKEYGTYSGIYIWTHNPSGKKYVGSANHLPTRLRSYFSPIAPYRIVGKFLPILTSSPITDFSLEVIFTASSSNYHSEMVLEQYFLLFQEFSLNTIRVSNNPSGSAVKSIFMYNRDGTICYYSSSKQIDFVRSLGVHKITIGKHLKEGTYYLGKYIFSIDMLPGSISANITVEELRNMLEIDRSNNNKTKMVVKNSVTITLTNITTSETYSFISLGSAVKFLKNASHRADQRTLVKRLNTNEPYYGYTCHKAK